jgi:WD40 repeat protein
LRGRANCHEKDITCADYFHKQQLIATGGQDNKVKLFNYETMREITVWEDAHQHEVTIVRFL